MLEKNLKRTLFDSFNYAVRFILLCTSLLSIFFFLLKKPLRKRRSKICVLYETYLACIIASFHAFADYSLCYLIKKMQADIDNSGTIDYGEFVAATLQLNKTGREDHLFAAFSYFDKDGSGYITADELQQACDEFGIEDIRLEDMIREVDQDNVSIQYYI